MTATEIYVPAPWGMGVVLGLVERLTHLTLVEAPVEVQVVQQASEPDFEGALLELRRRAHCRGISLPETVPWDIPWRRGPVGTVRVVECVPCVLPSGALGGRLRLADPHPCWGPLPLLQPEVHRPQPPGWSHKGALD